MKLSCAMCFVIPTWRILRVPGGSRFNYTENKYTALRLAPREGGANIMDTSFSVCVMTH